MTFHLPRAALSSLAALSTTVLGLACEVPTIDPPLAPGLAVLGGGSHSPEDVEVAELASELATPRDLAFSPDAPDQLWIANEADNSIVIVTNIGSEGETRVRRNAFGSDHFLSKPSALAFGAPGRLATAQDEDQVTQPQTPPDFMGPTLWPSDIHEFNGGHASHLDMLHNSPSAAGIAWDRDNAYWVFDGAHGALSRYDFQEDHGPAGEDHSDGELARYVDGEVAYVPGVSSHLELDHDTGLLYVADTGNARIAVLDTATGERGFAVNPNYDGGEQYKMMGATLTTLVDGADIDMPRPSGLALKDGVVYVTDNETAKVLAFGTDGALIDWLDLSSTVESGGLMGIDFDAEGRLFLVDAVGGRVLRIAPK